MDNVDTTEWTTWTNLPYVRTIFFPPQCLCKPLVFLKSELKPVSSKAQDFPDYTLAG